MISSFLDSLAIKNVGIKTIEKIFYGAQIQTVEGFLTLQEEQIASLPGLGTKSSQNIVAEIKKGIANATYPKLMAASACFGEGIGDTVCSTFIEAFPNWKYMEISPEMIKEIKGFGGTRSEQLSKGLITFKEQWFGHPLFLHLEETPIMENQDLKGQTILFSGFRDEDLKIKLERRGAKVPGSFVKTTTMLVVKSKNESSSKITEAQKHNIPIYTKEEFLTFLK
jgi:DNA ligase (NAD+)